MSATELKIVSPFTSRGPGTDNVPKALVKFVSGRGLVKGWMERNSCVETWADGVPSKAFRSFFFRG